MTAASAASHVAVGGATGGFPARVVADSVRHVLSGERRAASIAVTFLGPRRMQLLNAEYKHHDRPTDVISFALPLPDGSLTGDVYLCRWMAAREAHARGLPVREEILRLVVHGTLHVLGHDHPEGEERTQSAMWRTQERYVKEFR